MVDVNVDFVLEPDVTYTADIKVETSVKEHNRLLNRELPDQHPMSAITGLENALDSKVEKTDNVSQVYGTDSEGNQTTYDVNSFGQVDDVQVDGISIVENKIANLGTMALESLNDYSTKAVADTLYADISYEGTIDNHIANKNNPHEVTKAQVGLGNVDNTSDLDKPISTAAQTAFDGKADKATTLAGYGITNAYTKTEVDTALSGKQDSLDTTQMAAVNSGANATNIGQIATNTSDISTINGKIPSAASTSNQLADKEFVNSSISTNTARFIGTFSSVTALESYSGTVTNNDYAFVTNSVVTDNGNDWTTFAALDAYNKDLLTNFDYGWVINGSKFDLYRFDIVNQEWVSRATNIHKTDVTLNSAYNRYKATVTSGTVTWEYEYTLNNSSFTASQWAAINSGITSGDVDLIATALQPNDNISELNNDSGYITGITSSDVTTALGYTPYNSSNPSGYTSNVGTVTSVNNTSPDGDGNVSLAIPTVNNATLTLTQSGTTKGTFTANASSDVTINLDSGGELITIDSLSVSWTSSDASGTGKTIDVSAYTDSSKEYYPIVVFADTDKKDLLSSSCGYSKSNQTVTVYRVTTTQMTATIDSLTLIPVTDKGYTGDSTRGITNGTYQSILPYYTKSESDTLLSAKQNNLTAGTGIDITSNVISVDGEAVNELSIDNVVTQSSNNLITSGAVYFVVGDIETLLQGLR